MTITSAVPGRTATRRIVPLASLGVLLALDAILMRTGAFGLWFGYLRGPYLVRGLVPALLVGAAVGLVAILAANRPLVGAVGAAAISVAASVVATMEWGPWHLRAVGFAELAGLAYITTLGVQRLRPARVAAVLGAFTVAIVAVAWWRLDLHGARRGMLEDFLLVLLMLGFVATVGLGALLRGIDRRRVESDRRARQDERNEIARELHDLVAHHVTGIVLQAQSARLVGDRRPEVADSALTAIEGAGVEALRSMRAMVGSLRAPGGPPRAPTATIDDVRNLAEAGLPGEPSVRVAVDDQAAVLPAAIVASVHRITREGVTNARRHARGATVIDVEVTVRDDAVHVRVADDGEPTSPRPGHGFGLVGIAERVAALDGRLSAGPRPSGGWELFAVIPVRPG